MSPRKLFQSVYRHWIGRTFVHCLVGYVLLIMLVAFLQRQLIYQPRRSDALSISHHQYLKQTEDLKLVTADGLQLNGWIFNADQPAPVADQNGNRKALLYFPGNAGHREYRISRLELLASLGRDVIIFDYRGYGDNPGKPTETDFQSDALSIWKHVTQTLGYQPHNIALWGESLGGGVATDLAHQLSVLGEAPERLVMQSTFSSLVDAAGVHYPWIPVSYLLIDRYESDQKLSDVECPVLIIHGTADKIVPYKQAERNYAIAQQRLSWTTEFVTLPDAGHNNVVERYWDELKPELSSFLVSATGQEVVTQLD